MTFKIEENIATLELKIPSILDSKFDHYDVKIIIERRDGKEITTRNAEIVLTSAIKYIAVQRTGELTE